MYPERFRWSDPQEAVWDWLQADRQVNFHAWNLLMAGEYNEVGIACSSQKDFEQVCVIELGKNVKPAHMSVLDEQEMDAKIKLPPDWNTQLEHTN